MKIVILLPTYNEKDNLPLMVEAICQLKPQIDIFVIDDNSPDGTGKVAENLREKYRNISVIHRKNKEGLGRAYIHGFYEAMAANYDKVITMDCDFSHDPKYLVRMVELSKQYDLVLGSRYVPGGGVDGWSLWRKFISRGGNIYARIFLNLRYKDLTGGFKCYDVKVLRSMNLASLCSQGYTFQVETTYRIHNQGYRIKEFPIVFKDRVYGESKMSFDIAWEAIKILPRLRFYNKREKKYE
ncbi:polyprenol monophosphomannose synthase [Candidatus Uabimicrobium amorphum]|uniref:Dolichol-phosphate mannosyltransferase n=1 Tax=Uabimicrobium amorphum TaxID=2596890 RepID=A0A5S9IVA6_UABAM|nr:polyprenol monophosphomannose synthase [Candidatus Uabimicrobium amorphum]BBM88161.1 dolichol-phosphate mannosyltransferase [Candidatus Uabimicrobium amorphum]